MDAAPRRSRGHSGRALLRSTPPTAIVPDSEDYLRGLLDAFDNNSRQSAVEGGGS
ncbi:MAG: hypothetical protein LC808_32255 [Actinobacteria bacterium]|nr:hypothetical protein [Actinomycetota bacterium]